MNDLPVVLSDSDGLKLVPELRPSSQQWKRFVWATIALVLLFGVPLYRLLAFAAGSELYSFVILIPGISLYTAWLARNELRQQGVPNPLMGTLLLVIGLGALLGDVLIKRTGAQLLVEDHLALTTVAFVISLFGAAACFLGRRRFRALAFPLGFLGFMAPLPTHWLTTIETFMQHGSAAVAHVLYSISGMPVFYDNLTFELPGIALRVAPECSGIRSTLVLLIVSVLTGYLFLRSPRRRAWLVLAIIPLALARNGLRIFVIGELCVRIGPEMIDSYLHRKGGPIFFALSLVPLFLLLIWLQRGERRLAENRADPLPSATN